MSPRKKAPKAEVKTLTPEEKKVAKTSVFLAHVGRSEWGWRGKGLSPESKVAQLRGIKFEEFKSKDHPNRHNFYPDDLPGATKALAEIATWLGYGTWLEYNKACETKPGEVRKRLKEAK